MRRADRMCRSIYSLMSKRLSGMPMNRCELARDLGLTDARGAGEQIVADGLVGIAQTGAATA
jgi:hypothetical protein